MPKLPTFTADLGQVAAPAPRRASSADFGGQVGAELQTAGHQGMAAYRAIADSEARQVIVGRAALVTKYAKRLDEAAVSGEDLGEIKQQMNDELSKLGDSLATPQGKDALDMAVSTTNQMFDAQANAISVRRAGEQAKNQAGELMRNLSATIATQPSYLPIAVGEINAFTGALPGLPDEAKERIKQQLAAEANVTAAMASARLMPEETQTQLPLGKWQLTGEQALQVQAEADRTIRARRVDAEYQHTLSERRKTEANDNARRDLYKGLRAGSVGEHDILGNLDLKPETQEHLINVMERMAREKQMEAARTDPALFNRLREQIDAKPGTPGRIVNPEAVWAHYGTKLSQDDATFLENRIYANRSPAGYTLAHDIDQTLRNLAPELDKSDFLRGLDPGGKARVQAFTQWAYGEIDKAVERNEDVRELLNPQSPKYIGHAIPRFQTAAQRSQAEVAGRVNRAFEKRRALKDILGE